jgi:hypothetical protein
MRTLVDLPDPHIEALAALCARTNQKRAAVIRAAVAEYLERHGAKPIDIGFGLWDAAREDGLAYQAKVRAEW